MGITLPTLLIFSTKAMQAHPIGQDLGFMETIRHLFAQADHSHLLVIAAGVAAVAYCLRLALATKLAIIDN